MIIKILAGVIIGIILMLFIFYLILKNKRNIFLKELRFGHIGKNISELVRNIKKYEIISNKLEIQELQYLVIKSHSKRTIKIFEFDRNICTGFYIRSTEMAYSLSDDFSYEKEFEILEDDNFFSKGIDTTERFREVYPTFLTNGISVKLNTKYGKLFKSISTDEVKYRPLSIFVIHKTHSGLENFIKILKIDLLKELSDFNTDQIKIRIL